MARQKKTKSFAVEMPMTFTILLNIEAENRNCASMALKQWLSKKSIKDLLVEAESLSFGKPVFHDIVETKM